MQHCLQLPFFSVTCSCYCNDVKTDGSQGARAGVCCSQRAEGLDGNYDPSAMTPQQLSWACGSGSSGLFIGKSNGLLISKFRSLPRPPPRA